MSVKALAISAWVVVATILGVVCILSSQQAEGAESVNTGHINEDTRVCAFNDITPDAVETFNRYDVLITKLEAVGFEGLTQAERMLGAFLSRPDMCGTIATDYRVVLIRVEGDYVLLTFDEGYGFVPQKYITFLESFVADEVL